MSRALIGHERTRARTAVAALAGCDPAELARLLEMRRHTVAAILDGRMRPGPRFAAGIARIQVVSSRLAPDPATTAQLSM